MDYEQFDSRLEKLLKQTEEQLSQIPYIDKLLEIKGVGFKTVPVFIAEVGDLSHFDNPKRLQKLAGLAIISDESGKYKGQSHISYCRRKRPRCALYEMALSAVGKNIEFKELYRKGKLTC